MVIYTVTTDIVKVSALSKQGIREKCLWKWHETSPWVTQLICEILFLHLPEETQEAFFMSQKKSVKNITNKKGN